MLERQFFKLALRDVKACNLTSSSVQRRHRLDTANVFALNMGARQRQLFNHFFHGKAMAGMNPQHLVAGGQNPANFPFKFRGQGFQHGCEPRRDAVPSPHQLLGQGRQGGTFPTLHVQQRHAQLLLALTNQAPSMPVRGTGFFTRARQTAMALHFSQQLQ